MNESLVVAHLDATDGARPRPSLSDDHASSSQLPIPENSVEPGQTNKSTTIENVRREPIHRLC
jgi:hypothetical protein